MSTAKTANQIKDSFQLLASGHLQINSFAYDQEFNQQAYPSFIYPLMFVDPLGGSLSGTTYTRTYRVAIADRVLKSEDNKLEVLSDTQLIILDVLAYWMKLGQNERFTITSTNTITPFYDKWGDEVTGHFVDIGIEEFYDFNSCAIPLSSAIPSPTNPCKDARILINSVIYGNAPSDTNFNVVVKDQLGALVGSLIGGEWIVNTGGACADATYTIEDSLGNVLYTGTIPSGGSVTEVIGNSTLNVNKSDGTLISSRSILAEGTDSYNVGDSSAVLKDEDGNTLSTTPIKATETEDIVAPNGDVSVNSVAFDDVLSGGTLNIEVRKSTGNDLIGSKQGQYWRIGDSTAVIKDSANNTLKSEAIMATETENIVVNDSVAVIKNSAGTTLKSENILAQATENITINDSSVENSDATYSVDVLAEGSLVLPDSQINVNGVDEGDVVSVKTIDVNLEDSLGDPVTPTSVGLVGNTLTIKVPSGGATMTADFSADILVAEVGETITFTDATDNSPTDWAWDFNGQGSSFLQNPTFEFDSVGFKDITLLAAKNSVGDFITKSSYIEVVQDPIVTAFLTATSITDTTIISALTKLVYDLRVNNLLSKFTAIYPFVGGTATTHKFNLINPADTNAAYRLLFSGGWTHNSRGAIPNGSNASADTFLAPNVFGQNDIHGSVYLLDNNLAGSGMDFGIDSFYFSSYYAVVTGAISNVNNTGLKPLSIVNQAVNGYYIATRLLSTERKVYKNGNLFDTFTATSTTPSSLSIQLAWRTGTEYSPRGQAFASFGTGLTANESLLMNTIVNTFQQTLGRRI